jgi:hypothetical protein
LSKQELAAVFDAKNHLAASGRIIDNTARIVKNATKQM